MDPARKKLLSITDRLAPRAGRMLREITSYAEPPLKETRGSSDIGNVSQVVPTLQPNVPIASGARIEIHTRAFAEATTKPQGIAGMMEGIRMLALTGYELFSDPSLVKAAWRTFRTP
jgi:hypothetical protein